MTHQEAHANLSKVVDAAIGAGLFKSQQVAANAINSVAVLADTITKYDALVEKDKLSKVDVNPSMQLQQR